LQLSRFPSIPDFAPTLEGVVTAVRSIKEILETLGGHRFGASLGAALVYVQATPPGNQQGIVTLGDFWIESDTRKLHYWDGSVWQPIFMSASTEVAQGSTEMHHRDNRP
jgi:hypothetical protein